MVPPHTTGTRPLAQMSLMQRWAAATLHNVTRARAEAVTHTHTRTHHTTIQHYIEIRQHQSNNITYAGDVLCDPQENHNNNKPIECGPVNWRALIPSRQEIFVVERCRGHGTLSYQPDTLISWVAGSSSPSKWCGIPSRSGRPSSEKDSH